MYQGLVKVLAFFGLMKSAAFAEDGKGASGADGKGGANTTETEIDDDASGDDDKRSVSYQTHKKMLGEVKKTKADLKTALDKLTSAENDKLQADGKKDELITKLRGDLATSQKAAKDALGAIVIKTVDTEAREIAASMGCIDVKAIKRFIDLSDIGVDPTTLEVDKTELTAALEGLRKSNPYLFSKVGPKINSKLPGGKLEDKKAPAKKLIDLPTAELWDRLRALNK